MYLLIDLHSYFVRSSQKETRMNVREKKKPRITIRTDVANHRWPCSRNFFCAGFNDRGGLLCVKGRSFHLFA